MAERLRHLLFVLNPVSGDINKDELETTVRQICMEHGRTAAFWHTTGKNDLQKLTQYLSTQSYDAVFAIGGDGTVNLVGEALLSTNIPLGILPMGSGNGLSKDLNIPQDMEEALELIWHHEVRAIDTLRVSGHFSAHLADLGFNALIVKRFDEGDTRGPGAYVRIALAEYGVYKPCCYVIETNQETVETEAFMLTIANANTFGSNVVINPNSQIDDGQFEICLIAPFPTEAAPALLYRLYTQDFDNSDYTRRLSCHRASISVPGQQQVLVQVDGEPLELELPIVVEMIPRSLRVLTPRQG